MESQLFGGGRDLCPLHLSFPRNMRMLLDDGQLPQYIFLLGISPDCDLHDLVALSLRVVARREPAGK